MEMDKRFSASRGSAAAAVGVVVVVFLQPYNPRPETLASVACSSSGSCSTSSSSNV